jgi:hypothetical protein
MAIIAELVKYPLPGFLEGRITPAVYYRWLHIKAATLLERDKKRKKPYALTATKAVYKGKIHAAVTGGGQYDPYTGEPLAWELISTWDSRRDHPEGYKKKFALLPTVDHITPDVLEFEICSWVINDAKNDLDPAEFVELCRKVVGFRR